MRLIIGALLIALAIAMIRYIMGARYVFLVRVENGVTRLARGTAKRAFVEEVGQVLQDARVAKGWVGGTSHKNGVVLEFSKEIPAGTRQQLRNIWNVQ